MNTATKTRLKKMFKDIDISLKETDPEFIDIITHFSQEEVIKVSKLTEKEQMLCILSVLLGTQGMGEFKNMVHAALNIHIEPVAIKEVIYQATAYLGISRTYDFLIETNKIMEMHGILLPLEK